MLLASSGRAGRQIYNLFSRYAASFAPFCTITMAGKATYKYHGRTHSRRRAYYYAVLMRAPPHAVAASVPALKSATIFLAHCCGAHIYSIRLAFSIDIYAICHQRLLRLFYAARFSMLDDGGAANALMRPPSRFSSIS